MIACDERDVNVELHWLTSEVGFRATLEYFGYREIN